MESLKDVSEVIKGGVWMTSVDLMHSLQCLFTNLIKNISNLNGFKAFINSLVCQIDIPK